MDESLDYYTHRMICLAIAGSALLALMGAYRLYVAIVTSSLTKEGGRRLNGRCAAAALLILIPLHAAFVQYVAMRGLVPFVHLIRKVATKGTEAFDHAGFMHMTYYLQLGILAMYLVELALVVVAFLALGPAAHGDQPHPALFAFWPKRRASAAPVREGVQ